MVDRNLNINGWNEAQNANYGQPTEMRKTPYGFSNKKVDSDLANLLSGGGNPVILDTHNECVKVSDYLANNKNNLTLGDQAIIENMIAKFQSQEEAFERRNESHGCPAEPDIPMASKTVEAEAEECKTTPTEKGKEPEPPKETETVESKEITPAERKEARENGVEVAKQLIGYTTDSEQKLTVSDLQKVNSENVIDFFKGYEKQLEKENAPLKVALRMQTRSPLGAAFTQPDHFFEQMITENNFHEKQDLARGVAKDLLGYMENKYGKNSEIATEIAIILEDPEISKEQAKILDQYVLQEISPQNTKKNRAQAFGLMGVMGAVMNANNAE